MEIPNGKMLTDEDGNSHWAKRIVCIEINEDSEYDDCRQITHLGFLAPSLTKRKMDRVWWSVNSSNVGGYFVWHDEQIHKLQAAEDGDYRYVRAADEDTPSDPLLNLPTCDEYERSDRYEDL